MIVCRVPLRNEDRVVPPSDGIQANHIRKPFEIVRKAMLVGHIWFNVPSIRCDGHEPVLTVILQEIHMRKHRRGILCAKTDDIHHGRIVTITADLFRIIGIADTDEAFLQPICKPLRVEGGDVCSLSRK